MTERGCKARDLLTEFCERVINEFEGDAEYEYETDFQGGMRDLPPLEKDGKKWWCGEFDGSFTLAIRLKPRSEVVQP